MHSKRRQKCPFGRENKRGTVIGFLCGGENRFAREIGKMTSYCRAVINSINVGEHIVLHSTSPLLFHARAQIDNDVFVFYI